MFYKTGLLSRGLTIERGFTFQYLRYACNERIFRVQQKKFEKQLLEVYSPYLYASFGTFCVQISQLVKAQWVFKFSKEFRNRQHFPSKPAICRCSSILQRLTVPRIIDQFWRKRCQKKRKDMGYNLLQDFFQKYFVVHER